MNIDDRARRRLNDLADNMREDGHTEISLWLLVLAGEIEWVGWNGEGEATFRLKEDAI